MAKTRQFDDINICIDISTIQGHIFLSSDTAWLASEEIMDVLKSKVLAIDDDESILMLFDTILPKEGFTVVSTPRGGTGITMAHDEKPDIIILDLGLPDIPGMEVCRVMRQDTA